MEKLQVFRNGEFGEIGVLMIDGREYFPATACAKILGYSNAKDAIVRHCKWVVKRDLPHPQSTSKTITVNYIPEGDLYRLIIRSKLPAAERFERWLMDEVLPVLRKHGTYTVPKGFSAPPQCRLCGRWETKIDRLPDEIRRTVDEMLSDHVAYRIVSEYLCQLGYDISLSAVWRRRKGIHADTPPCMTGGTATQEIIKILAAHSITLAEVPAVFDDVSQELQHQTVRLK